MVSETAPHVHIGYVVLPVFQTCFSGPLFSFDVHEDVRLVNDAAVERDEVSEGNRKR